MSTHPVPSKPASLFLVKVFKAYNATFYDFNVFKSELKREIEIAGVWVRKRKRDSECMCVFERERER